MLGLPLGLLLAYFTIGAMVQAFGSWRAPFFIAAIPGLLLAVFMFFIQEPTRGAAESVRVQQSPVQQPLRKGPGDPYLLVADPGRPGLQLRLLCLQLVHGADAAALLRPAASASRSRRRHHGRSHRPDRPDCRRLAGRQGPPALTTRPPAAGHGEHADRSTVHRLPAASWTHRDRRVRWRVQPGLAVLLQFLHLRLYRNPGCGRAPPARHRHGPVLCRPVPAGRWPWPVVVGGLSDHLPGQPKPPPALPR